MCLLRISHMHEADPATCIGASSTKLQASAFLLNARHNRWHAHAQTKLSAAAPASAVAHFKVCRDSVVIQRMARS